jgi:predicted RND superfamily exporter protein
MQDVTRPEECQDTHRPEPRGPGWSRIVERCLDRPRVVLAAGLLVVVAAGAFLPGIEKDTRSDAFIPPGHESLVRRDEVRERFGLADPMVVALVADDGGSVFTPEGLRAVVALTRAVERTPGIDTARITSLATESDIIGSETGLEVRPFLDTPPATQAEAEAVRAAVTDFALYRGSLVAEDGRATVVVAEVEPEADAGAVYARLVDATAAVPLPAGLRVHVAGEGGVTGHLGRYIDADARRMVPLAFLLILVVLSRTYRTARGVTLPLLVVVGAVVVALGAMAAAGVPYYLITTAMPVILVAIGVADGIHILGQYYAEMARDPGASQRTLVSRAVREMARPVTITSLTDCAGFLALALSSGMPPLRAFGVFASLGVLGAWLLSLFVLPAALVLLPRRSSKVIPGCADTGAPVGRTGDADRAPFRGPAARALATVARLLVARPRAVAASAVALAAVGLVAATTVRIDYERIRNFRAEEPIRLADEAINRHLDGSNYLDAMIVAPGPGALLDPELLRRIETFQAEIVALDHVRGSTSIVDYVKQMHRAFDGDRPEAAVLPASRAAVAQLMLLYDMQSDPDALEKVIDYDRQRANVRVFLDTGRYSTEAEVVRAAEAMLRRILAGTGAEAHLAGRVNVDYHWMSGVARSHFASVGLALAAITLVSALLFRSLAAGLLTAAPVVVAVLGIYAFMAVAGLWLGITTAMFAAVAIGLGVDFGVHLVDRLRALVRGAGHDLDTAIREVFPDTGRALLFNFACCSIGFGVLATSRVPTLVEFGLLTATAVAGSFLASMTMIPALVAWLRPAFLVEPRPHTHTKATRGQPRRVGASAVGASTATLVGPTDASRPLER